MVLAGFRVSFLCATQSLLLGISDTKKKVYCTWLKFARQHRGPFLTVENKVVEVLERLPHHHQICAISPQLHYNNR